jgi:two-component system phosphate regulon sensor histidine kinase PhoR
MKYMAERLDERIKTIVEQRNELEILLSGMIEGVLAVDTDERVIMLNQAAGRLFGVNPAEAQGRNILEVVRNTDLENFVRSALSSRVPVEREISIIVQGEERLLQAHGTLLREEQGLRTATLIVFHDITRLRMLENIRRDFVANVSHELKTPITSIKGFVETLLAGAKNDPEEAGHFLRIIDKQADRLSSIIDDLLNLSRIEQEEEKGEIQLEERQIRDILSGAIQSCKASAEAKNINIELLCPENLQALIEARLLELAVVNLIDNAIKYSESGSSVQVEALINDSEVISSVGFDESDPGGFLLSS